MRNAIAKHWMLWPTVLQRSVAALVIVLLLALVYLVLAGTPKPISPASSLFVPVSVQKALADSRPALSSADFSLRPVFAIKRVPPPPPQPASDEAEKASAEVAPTDEIVGSIDGVSLLGIFGSGEVAGIIIRLDNGERKRLPVGEGVKGWTLRSLEPRGALLQAATGQRALLEMAFATDQSSEALQIPTALSTQQSVSEEPSVLASDGGDVKAEAPPQPMSFESYYGGSQSKESGKK